MWCFYFSLVCFSFISLTVPKPVEEEQHAICQIVSDFANATANATLTRKLEGVCTSDELQKKLSELENNISRQIKSLQMLLINNGNFHDNFPKSSSSKREIWNQDYYIQNSLIPFPLNHPNTKAGGKQTKGTLLDARHSNSSSRQKSVREIEASKLNLTFQDSDLGKTFVFFWKINGINKTLNGLEKVVNSNSFLLYGHDQFIKFYPNHLGAKYMAFELVQPIPRKHRFSVMNFDSPLKDLSSQILLDKFNYATMYRVSQKKIFSGNYIKDDYMLIKITIYIDY